MRKKETLSAIEEKTSKVLIITLSLMIIVLGAAFIVITSQGAQNGYALQQEKLHNEELKEINQRLQTEITTTASISLIEDSEKVSEMQESSDKTFITKEELTIQ